MDSGGGLSKSLFEGTPELDAPSSTVDFSRFDTIIDLVQEEKQPYVYVRKRPNKPTRT